MSDSSLARRTEIQVVFGGVDISASIKDYLISLTYTDNEEDETDDLQIKLQDREGVWRTKWLGQAIQAAAASPTSDLQSTEETESKTSQYKVIAKGGLNVHSRAGSQYFIYGSLAYGTIIEVSSISGGWANFRYSGKNAYVNAGYLQAVYSSVQPNSSGGGWNIGDAVTATGRPQYSSYGEGTPGKEVTKYQGTITYLNQKNGVPYPIHVGHLGWFAENQVQKVGPLQSAPPKEKDASKGLYIQATIIRQNWNGDGKDDKLESGQFELDSVNASGPPATVTIKGTSLPYNSTIRQTAKSKSWENYNLSGIVSEIAGKNGMASMYQCKSNPYYTRVEQYRMSDIAFLQKLCHDAGASLKVTNNIVVIFDQAEYENKSPVRTIAHGEEGGYTKYKLATGENDVYTSCHVSYTGTSGKTISATAYVADYDKDNDSNQCLEIRQRVASQAEAMELAAKMLRLHNKYEFTATFTFPGDPKLLAGCTVDLTGFGAWNGRYIIKQAKHSISHSGYATQITLRKSLDVVVTQEGTVEETPTYEVGDVVMLTPDAVVYGTNKRYYDWVYGARLFVRSISGNRVVVSIYREGAITGAVDIKHIKKV